MNKLKQLLASCKFWAALIVLVLMLVRVWRPDFLLEAEHLAGMLAVLAAFILGSALENSLSANPR